MHDSGSWCIIEAMPDPESPHTKYPKRSQYKYAKSPYRIRNWAEYEAGLRRRGYLTVWLSDDAVNSRNCEEKLDRMWIETTYLQHAPGRARTPNPRIRRSIPTRACSAPLEATRHYLCGGSPHSLTYRHNPTQAVSSCSERKSHCRSHCGEISIEDQNHHRESTDIYSGLTLYGGDRRYSLQTAVPRCRPPRARERTHGNGSYVRWPSG